MRQLDLPFTKRGKRQQKRLHGPTKAFKCWCRDESGKAKIIHATDSAMARKTFGEKRAIVFTSIRAVRAPEHDGKPA